MRVWEEEERSELGDDDYDSVKYSFMQVLRSS
jgi:hypothetical protein